jgi:hypothetical protein
VLYMYMYVCVCVYTYIHIYIYIYMYVYSRLYTYIPSVCVWTCLAYRVTRLGSWRVWRSLASASARLARAAKFWEQFLRTLEVQHKYMCTAHMCTCNWICGVGCGGGVRPK